MASGKLTEVFRKPWRTAWIGLRLFADDKEAIRKAARQVGKSMSGYLVGLHRYAVGDKRDGA
jgi:hypothetical protein